MTEKKLLMFIVFCFSIFNGCGPDRSPEVYFHDNHRYSFAPIYRLAREEGPVTLILLDAHHDTGPGPSAAELAVLDGNPDLPGEEFPGLTAYNWVGALIETGAVNQVLWVSQEKLSGPERQNRIQWLEKVRGREPPEVAERKREIVRVLDWTELEMLTLSLPVAVSWDLDILAGPEVTESAGFQQEILQRIRRWKPDIVTVALSAPYQPDAVSGWEYFRRAYADLADFGVPFLTVGPDYFPAESVEEDQVRRTWAGQPFSLFYNSYFAPGSALWDNAPETVWKAFREAPPLPLDSTAEALLQPLAADAEPFRILENEYPERKLRRFADIARAAIAPGLSGSVPADPGYLEPENGDVGIAVRFIKGLDGRGCLAYPHSVSDLRAAVENCAVQAAFFDPRFSSVTPEDLPELSVEVSVFGPWIEMRNPYDFIPGRDAVMVFGNGEYVILQPGVAAERNSSRLQFLEILSIKAGYGSGGWTNENLLFYRSPCVFLKEPFLEK